MKKYILLAAAAISLAACNNDDNILDEPVAAQISATIGESGVSRATDSKWTPGDAIGITMSSRYVNIKHVTQDGDGNFTADNTLYFKNKREPVDLAAYYPFRGTEGTTPIIEASTRTADQTSTRQPTFDFLYASLTGVTGSDPNVNFEFSHQMCKLTLIFKNGNDGTDVSKISSYTLGGLILDGSFNTASGISSVKNGAEPEDLSIDLSLSDVTVTSGEALPPLIVFPQTVEKLTLKISDSEGQDYACELKFKDNKLLPGNNYQWTITVKKTALTVGTPLINDWNIPDEALESDANSELS